LGLDPPTLGVGCAGQVNPSGWVSLGPNEQSTSPLFMLQSGHVAFSASRTTTQFQPSLLSSCVPN